MILEAFNSWREMNKRQHISDGEEGDSHSQASEPETLDTKYRRADDWVEELLANGSDAEKMQGMQSVQQWLKRLEADVFRAKMEIQMKNRITSSHLTELHELATRIRCVSCSRQLLDYHLLASHEWVVAPREEGQQEVSISFWINGDNEGSGHMELKVDGKKTGIDSTEKATVLGLPTVPMKEIAYVFQTWLIDRFLYR